MPRIKVRYEAGTKQENTILALENCRDYLGAKADKVVDHIAANFRAGSLAQNYRMVQIACYLLGIEGYYPVRAMFGAAWYNYRMVQLAMLREQAS